MHIAFERTIASAYRFGAANCLAILGIAWLPFLLFLVAVVLLVVSMLPELSSLMAMGTDTWGEARLAEFVLSVMTKTFLILLLFLLVYAMVTVGLMRRALGQESGRVFIYFFLGAETWRMLGALVLLLVLAMALIIAYCLGVALISFLLTKISTALQNFALPLLVLGGLVFGIYAIVRAQFFLPAVVVAEAHIGIRRSWHLGRGNFWRIVGIVLAVSLPAYIVLTVLNSIVVQLALSGQPLPMLAVTPGKVSPDELRRYLAAWLAAFRSVFPIMALLQLLYMMAVTGLSAGAIATAYKQVTGHDADAPSASTRVTE